ncbi:hypothetical protein PVL29_022262 [Vitis rotundifolia]|uniref:Uncharacterized protein n=1 Tax=Vitis rotundifolia TaxID=103349 RepID=A0AA38YVG2_VITRO|nr:hypothetical protein PVL29_022262 [Vitis rotundifolia]
MEKLTNSLMMQRRIKLWDTESGHANSHLNLFMPYIGNRSTVTCAADGQVRRALVQNSLGDVLTEPQVNRGL